MLAFAGWVDATTTVDCRGPTGVGAMNAVCPHAPQGRVKGHILYPLQRRGSSSATTKAPPQSRAGPATFSHAVAVHGSVSTSKRCAG